MTRINAALMIRTATDLGDVYARANQAQQEPSVQKAWGQARRDISTAAESTKSYCFEFLGAWRRTTPAGGAAFNPLFT